METFLANLLTASFHGSIVIGAVLVLRLILRRAPRKYICLMWLLAGLRLLMPIELRSDLSLQPQPIPARTMVEMALDWVSGLPWVWGAIALCFALYSLISYLQLKAKVRDAVRIRGGWESEHIETAFILGFIRPRIYIPVGMTQESRKYILEHERTHLDKGDHWIKMIGFVALALHWFNPLVWVAYICLCRDIEMACDERVVQFLELEERKGYSAALLSCSAKQPHYMANPVAFGEVSVKQRILSVLHYRKPAFWVSLLAVLAIGFVSVCLLTSPPAPAAMVPAETQPEETKPRGYAEQLSVGEIAYTCEQAIEALLEQESYCIQNEQTVTYVYENDAQVVYHSEFRKHGENFLTSMEDGVALGGSLTYEGQLADFMGDQWMWMGDASGYIPPDAWLEDYSPKGKVVSFPEGTGILSPDTVAYHMEWTSQEPFARDYAGIVSCTFREDGTLVGLHREYSYINEDGDETRYENTLTLVDETPEVTEQTLRQVAEQVLTQEELEEYRKNLEVIDKIPSNKTSYDKDYALGAGSKQWKFMGEDCHVRIAAENATPTGLTLVYSEADDSHTALTAEEGFWLEKLVDGTWELVRTDFEKAARPAETIHVGWTTTDSCAIDWADTYGRLDHGYYRIGRYYTMTQPSGVSETAVCYAKFRLYDPNQEVLLSKCSEAVNALLARESYHIYVYDWMPEMEYDYYLNTEVWKNGDDFLLDNRYPSREDLWQLKGRSGVMRRNGVCYNLQWAGESVNSPVTQWHTNTYLDDSNRELWKMSFDWYDSRVESVTEAGSKITIQETYDYNYEYALVETVLTFDDTGALKGMLRSLLPKRDSGPDDRVLQCEMVVFDDSAAQVAQTIAAQDVSRPHTFSYAQDVADYPDGEERVRTKNFVNSVPRTLETVLDVIDAASNDCTLPAMGGMEPGANMSTVYYDPAADIWKVEFTASWDSSIYQAVYLNAQGITQRTLTLELEVE